MSCWLLWEMRSSGDGSESGGILKFTGVLAASISASSSGCQGMLCTNATWWKNYASTFNRCVYYNIYYKGLWFTLVSWISVPSPSSLSKAISRRLFVSCVLPVPCVGKAAYLKSMNDPILIEWLLGQLGCGYKARGAEGVLLVGFNQKHAWRCN